MKLRIREWMDLRGVSQSQLASGINVSTPSVNAWLVGKKTKDGPRVVNPDYETLERICHFLECSPNDLLELGSPTFEKTWRDLKR